MRPSRRMVWIGNVGGEDLFMDQRTLDRIHSKAAQRELWRWHKEAMDKMLDDVADTPSPLLDIFKHHLRSHPYANDRPPW